MLTSLFDLSLGCFASVMEKIDLGRYFSDPVHPDDATPGSALSTQPVLDASYKFYLLIQTSSDLCGGHSRMLIIKRGHDFRTVKIAICDGSSDETYNPSGHLYAIASRILLINAEPDLPADEANDLLALLLQKAFGVVLRLGVSGGFSLYHMWPLVVGSAAMDGSDRMVILDKVMQLTGPGQIGHVALATRCLERALDDVGCRRSEHDLPVIRKAPHGFAWIGFLPVQSIDLPSVLVE